MSGFEITCVNKDSRGLIIRVGGEGWSMPAHEAVVKIISHQLRMLVRIDQRWVDIGVRGEGSDAFLALEPDGFPLHDLAAIPSC